MLLRRSLARTIRATEPRPLGRHLMGTQLLRDLLPRDTHKSMHTVICPLRGPLSMGTGPHRRVSLVTALRVGRPLDGSNTLDSSAGIE